MTRPANSSPSLFARLALPFILMVVLLAGLFYVSAIAGGVTSAIDKNAESVLQERVANKAADIQTTFNTKWGNFDAASQSISSAYNALPSKGESSFGSNVDGQRQLLESVAPSLIDMLRDNEVSGVFLILNNGTDYQSNLNQRNFGMCIRDYDPKSLYTNNEDLLISRCPSSMIPSLGCSIDSNWEATYSFASEAAGDFYYQPLQQAYLHPTAESDNLAYYSSPHGLTASDQRVVSYSLPLVDETGYPYAVLGVEVTIDYLTTLVPGSTLYSADESCYTLVEYDEGSYDYSLITYNGTLFKQAYPTGSTFTVEQADNSENLVHCLGVSNGLDLYGSVAELSLYNKNTPFENHHVALVGMVKHDSLYGVSSLVSFRLVLISLVVLILGVIAVFYVVRRVTRPITRLSAKVSAMGDDADPNLDRLNIREIDELITSIESLSDKISRNQVRSEFFSRMSHDMRTPMNAIIGFSSREATEGADLPQMSDYMDKIHVSGTYLLGLINEVLDMTKIEAKRMELRLRPVSAKDLWDDVVSMIEEVSKEDGVIFTSHIKVDDSWIMADRQRVDQVIMNLLSNAVKFTPAGGKVTYQVSQAEISQGKITFTITIADTGCGMSEEFMARMYEPFLQEQQAEGGTGLGLAISRQIVELMHGDIACRSKKGKGTTFTVHLSFDWAPTMAAPSDDSASVASNLEALPSRSSQNPLSGKKVLLCEDNPINAQIADMLLQRRGMLVDHAADGGEGLSRFKSSQVGHYDIVLMDIRMPVMDGLQTARAIRALDRADAATVPIIAMTANAFAEDVEASKSAGMNDHLSKPVDPTILYRTLEKMLS